MKNIQKIHGEVFSYLNLWSIETKETINPYYYMRNAKDERFKKGYWFPGNDSYLCISFWQGGDSRNKTPNIYFEIHEKFGCRAIIVAKDSELKNEYFSKIVNQLNEFDNLKYQQFNNSKVWIKQYSREYNRWDQDLNYFIINDKRRIDEFIDKNGIPEVEEYISKFGFIENKDFDKTYTQVLTQRDIISELEYQRNREFDELPKLPFALLGITIDDYQGIKSASIENLRPDARWIFITGENGYGKTSLLQAIALGLNGDPDLEKFIDPKTKISIELVHKADKAFPVRRKGNMSKIDSFDYGQFVFGYGPVRLNIQSFSSENKENKSNNNVLSLFDNETLLKNINYELFASNYTERNTFSELEDIIKLVTNGRISEIKIRKREVLFIETLSNGEKLEPLPLSKLAAGFRSIINITVDIYLKLRKVHIVNSYKDFYGIILIDEIENHLHPLLQRELPISLSKVFPKVQFIISTHSPIPLLSAEKNSIILKVDRNKIDGVTIENLDKIIDLQNLLPNTILTSPIFGFQNIFSENRDNEGFVRVETTYNELLSNETQKERIAKFLDRETTDEILKLLKNK